MSKTSHRIETLEQVSLFGSCSRKELSEIARISTEASMPSGSTLCREGQTGEEFFVLVAGSAEVTIAGEYVVKLGPGSFFGEMALLDGGPRVATINTTSDSQLIVLNRSEFFTLLEAHPSVSRRILAGVGARLRAADMHLHAAHVGV